MSALGTVSRRSPITLGDLATSERVTPPFATKLANGLEERGLVTRVGCHDDKRVTRLELTKQGRAVLDRAQKRRNAWLAQRFARLTDSERVALAEAVAVLERLNREEEGPR
jgi:DNA-binding MarR family transcriptional regulator